MSRRLVVLAALVAMLALPVSPVMAGTLVVAPTGRVAGMSPGFSRALATEAPDTPFAAFVSVNRGLDAASVLTGAEGVRVVRNYPLVSAALVTGRLASLSALAKLPSVDYLQDNATLSFHGDTSPWATRVRVAQEAIAGGPYRDAAGNILTGAGVGVAIVDSGINATHPDLINQVARNFKIVCTTPGLISTATDTCYGNYVLDQTLGDGSPSFGYVEVPPGTSTDTSSGHGTHVAGIVAGDGTASTGSYPSGTGPNVKGTFTGVAPGATLYGFSTGEVISVLFATEAHYYILEHGAEFVPAVKVVNNSWGDGGGVAYDPNSIASRLNNDLIASGVTMVYSAGNDGGDGSEDATSSTCDNPTPGNICVANYDDETTVGGRDGALDATSSRGRSGVSNTWPDISAPGTLITSPCVREAQPICNLGYVDEARWGPWYSSISGTSMASPHIAGIVAMLVQADPSLTPAQIENLLQDHAHKFTAGSAYVSDPQNSGGTTSLDKGAGLADVKAMLDAMGVSHGTASAPADLQLIGGDGGDFAGPAAADLVSLSVTQTTGSSGAAGFRYDLAVANASDFGALPSVSYRVFQKVAGVEYTTTVTATPASVSGGTATPAAATPEDVTRVGNKVSFFLPFSKLGGPAVGEPVFGVQATVNAAPGLCLGSGCTSTVDVAPSSDPGLLTPYYRAMYGKSFARG